MGYIFDAHNDLLNRITAEREKGKNSVLQTMFLPELKGGKIGATFLSVWIEEGFRQSFNSSMKRMFYLFSNLIADLLESPDIALIKSKKDYQSAKENDKFPVFLSVEGLDGIETELSFLYILYDLGVRMASLTWNNDNTLAHGVMGDKDFGITALGQKCIRMMNKLGILLDLAHLSEKAFWEAISLAESEVIVSHTAVKALCDHPRNLDDAMIKAVADKNGVVCITAVSSFLSPTEDATIDLYVEHIKYVCDLVGVKYVGIGLDFEFFLPDELKSQKPPVKGLSRFKEAKDILCVLEKEGFTQEEISLITHKNVERLIEKFL